MESSLMMVKEKELKRRLNLRLDMDEFAEPIYADERKLKQILYNLISNAVKFTDKNGGITVTVQMVDEGSDTDGLVVSAASGLADPRRTQPHLP